MFTGKKKTEYQREYMRRRRAAEKKPARPAKAEAGETMIEQDKFKKLLATTRKNLETMSKGNARRLFAYRRKLFIKLMHDERGTPIHRRRLKAKKFEQQNGKCAHCRKRLPRSGSHLHRLKAWLGYTEANTELVHSRCHTKQQANRDFH